MAPIDWLLQFRAAFTSTSSLSHMLIWSAAIVLTTMAVSCAGVGFTLPILRRRLLVKPNARSLHKAPTPQGGGVVVVAATVLVAAAVLGLIDRALLLSTLPVFGATLILATTGAIDDIMSLKATPRILAQALAVLIVLSTLPSEVQVIPWAPWWLDRTLLLIGGIWFVNLVNFMDGMDLMTAVEVVPITTGIAIIAVLSGIAPPVLIVALALLGAVLGFVPFNRPAAKLFLGDIGSLPIGLLTGWMLLVLASKGHLAAATILPLYYLADATITLGRRMLQGEQFWLAHRSHFYQRAIEAGFTVPEVIGRVFALNVALTILATLTVAVPGRATSSASLLVAAMLTGILLIRFSRRKD